MPTTVEIPELGDVEFPDSMSHSDIIHAIDAEIMPRVRPSASLRAASSVTAPPEQGRGPDRLADVAAITPSGFPDVPGSERAVGEAVEALQAPTIQVPPEVMKFIVPAEKQIELLFGKDASDAYVQTAADLASGLTSPQNIAAGATAVATGPIGAAAIGSLFSIDALMKTPEQARRLGEAFGTGDRGQIAAAMTESVALGAQALGVGFVPAAVRAVRNAPVEHLRFGVGPDVLAPETAAQMRKIGAERQLEGPSIDIETAARPVTPPELPAGEARRLTPVEQALQDRVQQRLLPERVEGEPSLEQSALRDIAGLSLSEKLNMAESVMAKPNPSSAEMFALTVIATDPSLTAIPGLSESLQRFVSTPPQLRGKGPPSPELIQKLQRETERMIELTTPEPPPTGPPVYDILGNTAESYSLRRLKGWQMRGDERLATALKFYGVQDIRQLARVAERRFAERATPKPTTIAPALETNLRQARAQEHGEVLLQQAQEIGLTPQEIASQFFRVDYPKAPQEVRSFIETQIQGISGFKPGDEIVRGKPVKSWEEIVGAIELPESIEALQGPQRGLIASMIEARGEQLRSAKPAPAPVVAPEVEPPAKKAEPKVSPEVAQNPEVQPEEIPQDLAAEIEKQRVGSGPLTDSERVELNELRTIKSDRGKLGMLNQARLEHLESRLQEVPPTSAHVVKAKAVADYWAGKAGRYRETEAGLPAGGASGKALGGTYKQINERQAATKMQRATALSEKTELTATEAKELDAMFSRLPTDIRRDIREQLSGQRIDPATGALMERVAAENPPPPMGPDVPTEGGRSGHALGIVPTFVPGPTARFARDLLEQAVKYPLRFYSEPLIEQLARIGGPASKEFADVARRIVALAKARIGEMATQDLDAALRSAGKDTEANRWMMTIADTSKRWGYRHMIEDGLEGPLDKVPSYARDAAELYRRANSNTGRMAERDIPEFKAGGLGQREPTMFQMDLIRTGHGPAFEILVEALATDNSMPRPVVREILAKTKAEWDKPAAEANLRTIAQEYTRQFERFPTDLLLDIGPFGKLWVPILHASPYDYLLQTATRTAQRTAFLRFLPEERLNQYRTRIAAEGGNTARVFDNLVRSLHGLPIDEPFLRDFIPPGSPLSLGLSGANQMLSNVFAPLKLTVSALYNIPETVFGQTPRFLGWKKYMEALWRLKELYPHLETIGAVNRAIYNDALDPQSRMRSELRQFGNGLRRTTVQVFFNEAQEALAAATAYVTAERLRNGSITRIGREEAFSTARMMGFDDTAARQIAEGTASDSTYQMFIQRAAPFFTGGAMQPAEASQFANRRLATSLFRFHSYPMMKMNALRKVTSELADVATTGTAQQRTAAATMAARYLFGSTAQGLSTLIVKAMAYGGIPALAVLMSQSKDEPGEFWLDIMASDIGGPLSAIWYAQQNEGLLEAYNPEAVNAAMTFPGSMAMELTELLGGHGRFKDMPVQDRITRYFVEKIPAGRIISTVMATVGLSTEDKALDAAVRGFLEWRKENFGYKKIEDHTKADERKAFRTSMGKAMRAIEDQKDPKPFLEEAVGYSKKQTGEAVANSLLARRLLFRPDRSKLTDEDLDKLIANIGLPAVEKLEAHDEMLKTLADEIRRENP